MVLGVMQEGQILSSVERRPKHSALTHLLRRNWWRTPKLWQQILSKCVVAPYLGALPPELRACVPKEQLSNITYRFRMILEDFLIDKVHEMRSETDGVYYEMPNIGALFGTKCWLECGAINYAGYRIWSGGFGMVCKMSFPELHACYALKIFDTRVVNDGGAHGAYYEIPTAFAAAHAEPRNNARVYMASLIYEPYMLSRWEGDVSDNMIRHNENEIFMTTIQEMLPRNYRRGRLIDFGDTHRTAYGAAGYPVRKMYRKIMNALRSNDAGNLRQMAQDATVAAPATQKDFYQAVDLVAAYACVDVRQMIRMARSAKTY